MNESEMQKKYMAEAVQAVAEHLQLNTIDNTIRSRIATAISGGYDFADTMHNIYLDFGYPQQLAFFHFWNMYRRFGIARNVVDLVVNITWMTEPKLETTDAQFIREFEALNKRVKVWNRIKGLDKRQRVGRYAGMFMRVRDGKDPKEPIDGTLNGETALVQMVPLYEGQLKVLTTQDNPRADDYGMPTMYQFSSGEAGNRNEKTKAAFEIHPSRVVISAEGADDGGIYGVSALEAPYNSLMDLRKIIGAGGEGFYKNAAQSIVFNLQDGASAKGNETLLNAFNEQFDEFAYNRMRRAMWTPGMEAKTLDSALTNPKEFFTNALNDVAASVPCPATILIGQQTGRLASDQDMKGFLSMVNSRREEFSEEQVRNIIDWCMKYGILPMTDYDVDYDDLLALSDTEKMENAVKMADVNNKQFTSGGEIPFTALEIREAAGFDPEPEIVEEPEPGETDDI